MQIEAAVVDERGKLTFQELSLDEPRDNEVLVRVVATGICRLDYTMCASTRVAKPVVLGHEGAGIVERVGRNVGCVHPGDSVVMSFNSCGQCASCLGNIPAYCLEVDAYNFGGKRPDGSTALRRQNERVHSHFFGQSSFATHAICTERNVVRVPGDAPLELLAPLACGVQTGAGAVLNSLAVTAGSSVVVLGAGSVGLAAVMGACIAGATKIIAIDVQPSRLQTACALGATHTILAERGCELTAEIMKITGSGANFAVDTSGDIASILQSIRGLAPLGKMGLISECHGEVIPVRALEMMLSGRSLRGVHQGDSVPQKFIPQLAGYYLEGRLPLEKLVTFYDFKQIEEAMADMNSGKCIKPVLRMPSA
jgi:aryl-alcohol dehydrogenase